LTALDDSRCRRSEPTGPDEYRAHNGKKILRWAKNNNVHLCFTPTNTSWANPIEAHSGPLRQFTLANSHHPNHPVQTRALHHYPRWGGGPAAA